MHKLLIIEDDPSIAKGLVKTLEAEHFEVVHHFDGEKGYQNARRERFDLILLDLTLPSKSGEDICRSLRKQGIGVPILMLTSKNEEFDKVKGLDLGADDYVTKPFSLVEFLARVRALLRRTPEVKQQIESFSFGNIFVDIKRAEVCKDKLPVKFSKKEFEILRFFIDNEGEVVSRDMLLDKVWGYEHFPTTRTVDNFILSIRKKIEDDPGDPRHILTVHAVGYKFVK